ncbi:uncharacterized protein LOC111625160 [Centruroides sculpturatus]|uniref:uncharacterized protein LOC111625160 n=1 Tax=Centruroides sculpturatus TaxID=218467 RepID=UPI000C6EA1F1|nr:uncharacterized protein LOC111625160 [Centruroides sculpturatus]XP_023223988.1 uncharacterized protein LOC111625160 [Centruroides sculpturatus]XP_023223998.1 uncharacterized protein LOC111625160 [Centruroides sculpturatus]
MPEKESDGCAQDERQARSIALEKAYVHDVYDQIAPHFTDNKYQAWPRVKQFLLDLEPGSIVVDIGCGNGKYLDINHEVYKIGSDRCAPMTHTARRRRYEVLISDNLHLPFRDESFDAALSVAVVHHFATTERRIQALQELARILRIGGRVMITVWAMEQRHRKFESQDVLVPWYRPDKSSSDDRGSSAEKDLTSTTTSDDDILIYQAYSHTSDSDINSTPVSQPVNKRLAQRRQLFSNARGRYQGRSFEAPCNQNTTEMSSSGETCYNFLRRALQKLSNPGASYIRRQSYFYRKCRTSWFSDSQDSDPGENGHIELRHLEEEPTVMDTSPPAPAQTEFSPTAHRFKSLGDLFQIIPNILRPKKSPVDQEEHREKRVSTASDPREYARKPGPALNGIVRSRSTACCMFQYEEFERSEEEKVVVASNSLTSSDIANGNVIIVDQNSTQTVDSPTDEEKEESNVPSLVETSNQEQTSNLVEKSTDTYGQLMPESPPSHDEEEEERLVSYWSMPELRFLSKSSTMEEPVEIKAEANQLNEVEKTSSEWKSNQEENSDFNISDKMAEDEKSKLLRNGFVKRSLSIDINVPKMNGDQRQFSSSADDNKEHQSPSCTPRWNSLKSDVEETVSVVQWKGQSLQSDTSVESDESIISVIYRSPSELEALAGRTRRTSRSLQASPLTITSRGGSVEANSDSGETGIKLLSKYLDAECTEVREILQDIKPIGWKNKIDGELLKSRRSRSTSVDLDFRHESSVASSKDLRRSSLPCPMYVRKSLEIEEEEEDEDSKNDTVEVFTTKEDEESVSSKSVTFRRLCRSEPVDLSEDELDNLPDDGENAQDDAKDNEIFDLKTMISQTKSVPKMEGNKTVKKPVGILKHCCRASSLEEQSTKRVRLPRRSLSDASDPLSPIKELKSFRVRLCVDERPRGGGSVPRWNPTLIWQFSPGIAELESNDERHEESDDDMPIHQKLIENSTHEEEEKDLSVRKSLKQQSSEENDTSSIQFSRQSSTTSEDCSDLHRQHFADDERRSSSEHSRNTKEIIHEDSSDHDYSLPTHDIFNRSDSSDRKSSFVRESSEEQNPEESFEHDVSSVTASIGSKDTEEDLPASNHLCQLSEGQREKRHSRSTDESDVDLMQTSFTSIPENSFGKLEILPVANTDEMYDVMEWTSRNCDHTDQPSSLSRNTSQSLSTSQESLAGNDAGGPMTYHRYYHVFREGELDHLIETHVENLHIISSYYDHSNWCVVAEKVQVWTI